MQNFLNTKVNRFYLPSLYLYILAHKSIWYRQKLPVWTKSWKMHNNGSQKSPRQIYERILHGHIIVKTHSTTIHLSQSLNNKSVVWYPWVIILRRNTVCMRDEYLVLLRSCPVPFLINSLILTSRLLSFTPLQSWPTAQYFCNIAVL